MPAVPPAEAPALRVRLLRHVRRPSGGDSEGRPRRPQSHVDSLNATGVRIAGVGHFVPERVITNADLERMLDTSDEWITTRTGMKERHAARLDEPTSDLALAASRNALAAAGLEPADLNCIIVATVTPDYAFP